MEIQIRASEQPGQFKAGRVITVTPNPTTQDVSITVPQTRGTLANESAVAFGQALITAGGGTVAAPVSDGFAPGFGIAENADGTVAVTHGDTTIIVLKPKTVWEAV